MDLASIGQTLRDFASTRLFEIAGTPVTVAAIATFVVIMLATFWISSLVQRIAGRALSRGGISKAGTVSTVRKLIHYSLLLVGLAVALQTVGISLASLFAAGAVVAIAIGFALQNVLQNFVSGVILLVERSITEHDVLEVQGEQVVVERLGARATVARTRDDDQIIIPNSILVQSSVTNLTLADDIHRIRARVGVSYASDMKRVEAALIRAGESIERRVQDRTPLALLLEFGDSSVVWELSIWCTDPWAARVTRSDLHKAIWKTLHEEGITIAFPQLDLHIASDAR